jgi:hypothetical protein
MSPSLQLTAFPNDKPSIARPSSGAPIALRQLTPVLTPRLFLKSVNTLRAEKRGGACEKHVEESLFTSCVRCHKAVPGTVACRGVSLLPNALADFRTTDVTSEEGERMLPLAH